MNKNTKIIIIIICAIIAILVIGLFIINKSSNKDKANTTMKALDLIQVFDIVDIEKSDFEKEKVKDIQVSEKYIVGKNNYKLKAKVNFSEISGDMIYVREEYNKLNIFQTTYKINKYEDINNQINQYMNEFERLCANYMRTEVDEDKEGTLYGESAQKLRIPIEESIYNEGQVYTKTYIIKEYDKDQTYDINFYKSENNLTAEFVKILD